jgi:hypothetical protein
MLRPPTIDDYILLWLNVKGGNPPVEEIPH